MKVKGGVPIRRIPRTPTVSILPGERVFHKLPDGTYEPATITLSAIVQNIDNPKYQWGRILTGSFRRSQLHDCFSGACRCGSR